MEPLEYFSIKALLGELQKRFDDSVFIASAQMTGEDEDLMVSMKGSYHAVLGLTVLARMAAESGEGTHGTDTDENNTTN